MCLIASSTYLMLLQCDFDILLLQISYVCSISNANCSLFSLCVTGDSIKVIFFVCFYRAVVYSTILGTSLFRISHKSWIFAKVLAFQDFKLME